MVNRTIAIPICAQLLTKIACHTVSRRSTSLHRLTVAIKSVTFLVGRLWVPKNELLVTANCAQQSFHAVQHVFVGHSSLRRGTINSSQKGNTLDRFALSHQIISPGQLRHRQRVISFKLVYFVSSPNLSRASNNTFFNDFSC